MGIICGIFLLSFLDLLVHSASVNVSIRGMSNQVYNEFDTATVQCDCVPDCQTLSLVDGSDGHVIHSVSSAFLNYTLNLTRSWHQKAMFCRNNERQISNNILYAVYWYPTTLGLPQEQSAPSGRKYICSAIEANLPSSRTVWITWYLDNDRISGPGYIINETNITASNMYQNKQSSIHFTPGRQQFGKSLRCGMEKDGQTYIQSAGLPLKINYLEPTDIITKWIIIGAAAGGALLVTFLVLLAVCICKRKKRAKREEEYEELPRDVTCCCCVGSTNQNRGNPQHPFNNFDQPLPPSTNTLTALELKDIPDAPMPDIGTTGTRRYTHEPMTIAAALQHSLKKFTSGNDHVTKEYEVPAPSADNDDTGCIELYDEDTSRFLSGATFTAVLEPSARLKALSKLHDEAFAEMFTANVGGSSHLKDGTYYLRCPKKNGSAELAKEIVALKAVKRHERLVPLLAEYNNLGVTQLLLPHYEYGTLASFLLQHRTEDYFTQDHVMTFALDVCDALIYLHAQDPVMLHPNLGQDQVYVTLSGGNLSCQLFGFLSQADCNLRQQNKWKHGKMELFRAPEIQSRGNHTRQTDMWDWGFFLYTLVTLGETPFVGDGETEVREYIRSGELLPKPNCCSDEFYNDILQYTSPSPSLRARFKSARARMEKRRTDGQQHVDIDKAQNNLEYENKRVVATLSQRKTKSQLYN